MIRQQREMNHRVNVVLSAGWYSGSHGKVQYMALNIKNEETQRLARELSELTGESVTAAITEALRQRLDRVRSEQGMRPADRLLKIGKDCAVHLREPYRSSDPDLW